MNTWYKFLSPLDPQRILKHGLPEIVVAAILTVAIIVAWKRVETGRGEAEM